MRHHSNRRPSDFESKSFRPAGTIQARSGCSRQPARPACAFLTCRVTAGGMTKGMTSLATAEPPGGGQPRKVAARRDRNRKQGDSSRAGQRQTRRWVSAAAVMPGRSRPAIRAGGQEGRRWVTEGTRQRGLGRQRPLRRYSHPEQVVGPEAATTRLPLVTGGNLRPPPGPTRPTRVPGSVARSGQGCDHRWPTADTVSARAKDQGSQ